MKKIITVSLFTSVLTLSFAMDVAIDEQIEKIRNAPAQERVKLMNQFKMRLHAMNKEERSQALGRMQAKMQSGGEMAQTLSRDRERVRQTQVENSADAVNTQNMHQKQIGSQMAHGHAVRSSQSIKIPVH